MSGGPWISLAFLFFLVFSVLWTYKRVHPEPRLLILLLPALAILLLGAAGSLFERQPHYEPVLIYILVGEIVLDVLVIIRLKNARIFAVIICLWLMLCSLAVAFWADMSITDEWL